MLLLAHLEKLGQEEAVNSDEYGFNKQPEYIHRIMVGTHLC
jgi:hypothetical protein